MKLLRGINLRSAFVLGLLVSVPAFAELAISPAAPGAWQQQDATGPGGNTYPHARAVVTRHPKFILFEPAQPRPFAAPLLIYISPFGSNMFDFQYSMFEHLARRGIMALQVLFNERNGLPTPAEAARNSIAAGLKELADNSLHVTPNPNGLAYAGWSSGGYTALYFANNSERFGFGKTLAYVGHDHSAASFAPCIPPDGDQQLYWNFPLAPEGTPREQWLRGLESRTLVLFTTTEETTKFHFENFDNQSFIYSDWGLLQHVEPGRKNFLQVNSDAYGQKLVLAPPGSLAYEHAKLSGDHYAVAGIKGFDIIIPDFLARMFFGQKSPVPIRVDPLDWNGFWRPTAAAIECAFSNKNCEYVLGSSQKVTEMGKWRDGTPIHPLTALPAAIPDLGKPSTCP